jgi:hypothetical protein
VIESEILHVKEKKKRKKEKEKKGGVGELIMEI